jgi:hypothetical protein
MKLTGAVIEHHSKGNRWIVKSVEPDSFAAAMGLIAGDEFINFGRTLAKQIRPEDGIEVRRNQKVGLLRSGALIELVVPAREKPSNKYKIIASEITTASADQLDGLAQQVWGCLDLSDDEKGRLGAMIDRKRKAPRRVQERELPLPEAAPADRGLTGDRYRDRDNWCGQLADDAGLSLKGRQLANIVAAKYINVEKGPDYFCTWVSITTVRGRMGCARATAHRAFLELEARGYWKIEPQKGRAPRLIKLCVKPSEKKPVVDKRPLPAPEPASPAVLASAISQPPAVDENCAEGFTPAELDALARGAAICLRPSLHSIAAGTAHRRRAEAKPTGREALAEADAQRKAKAERQEAAAAREAEINRLCANQARGPLFEAEYDPCGRSSRNSGDHNPFAYRPRPVAGSPIG